MSKCVGILSRPEDVLCVVADFLHFIRKIKGCERMADFYKTQYFKAVQERTIPVSEVLAEVYQALTEKGYDPVNQIVGYVMSGDPTYITSYNGARNTIMKVERDEIMEELMKSYIKNHLKG